MVSTKSKVFIVAFILILALIWKNKSKELEGEGTEIAELGNSNLFQHLETSYLHILADDRIQFPEYSTGHIDLENEKYFMYLPYEGMSNQLYCLLRGLFVAKKLNRTLLIPPLVSSHHDSLKGRMLDWRHVVNFTSIDKNPQTAWRYKFIDYTMIENIENMINETEESHCFTYGRWKYFYVLGRSAINFKSVFGFQNEMPLEWYDFGDQRRAAEVMIDIFHKRKNAKLLCAANLLHLSFGNQVEVYWKAVTYSDNVIKAAWTLLSTLGVGKSRFGAIHWRRGDFKIACNNKILKKCWPSLDDLKDRILKIKEEQGIDLFLVGTNDPDFQLDMSEYGVDVIKTSMPQPSEGVRAEWSSLGAVVVDAFLFLHADYFVGNIYSSISLSVIVRRRLIGLKDMTSTF